MKKVVFLLFITVFATCLLTSCGQTQDIKSTNVKTDFQAVADVEYDGNYLKYLVKNEKTNGTEITVKEPQNLEGFSINILNDKNNIAFKDLCCETKNLPVLNQSAPSFINRVLNDISMKESLEINEKDNSISGECSAGKYTAYIDRSNGFISKITSPDVNLNIVFSSQTIL